MPAVVRAGIVETAANIDAAWIGVDAAEQFGQALGRDVTVMNDADAAGLAEMRFGAGKGHAGSVVVVTLGTGIGSAVFADGAPAPATPSSATCHSKGGDAEDWAADSVRDREDLSWKHWAHRLEHYFSLLESLLWPELIIVGGGVSKKAEKFLPHIDIRTPIVAAQLQNEAGIIGAAVLASAYRPSAHDPHQELGASADRRRRRSCDRPMRKRASRGGASERMAMRRRPPHAPTATGARDVSRSSRECR